MPRHSELGPTRVILIRHAQKTGIPGDRDLSELGIQRAKALLSNVTRRVEKIVTIIAAKSSRKSRRPRLTVEPFAEALGTAIEESWDTEDYQALASHLLHSGHYQGKAVLICWRHDTLQDLAQALGAGQAPSWGPDLYDRIWLLDMTEPKLQFEEA